MLRVTVFAGGTFVFPARIVMTTYDRRDRGTAERRTESFPKRFGHVLFQVLATIYFIAGFVILGARWFVTTQLDHYREDVTAAISASTGITLNASSVKGSFRTIRPVIELENVTLSRPGGPVSLELPRIEAELSWASLWHLEPRFHRLLVADPQFTVRRLSDTEYDIGGVLLDVSALRGDETRADASSTSTFASWLLAQSRLILKNGTFTYVDERPGVRPLPVLVRETNAVFDQGLLDWKAALEGTVVEGTNERHFVVRSRIEKGLFSVDADPATWKGEAYAAFDSIDMGRLMRRVGLTQYLRRGSGAARIWTTFDAGNIRSAAADVHLRDVEARLAESLQPLHLSKLVGRLAFEREGSGPFVFSADQLAFTTDSNVNFGPSNLRFALGRDEAGRPVSIEISASALEIGTLTSLSGALPFSDDVRSFLARHPLSGSIRDLELDAKGDPTDPKNWRGSFGFYRLTLPGSPKDALPSFRNLGGLVSTRPNGDVLVDVNGPASTFVFPGVFRNPRLQLDELKGRVRVVLGETPTLYFENFRLANHDAALTASGSWKATGGAGTLDLSGKLLRAKATSVVRYLPNVVGESTLDYLEAALLAGEASGGDFVVRGELDKFPWVKKNAGQGLFRIRTDVQHGKLDFMPSYETDRSGRYRTARLWPVLDSIRASLLFEGESMRIGGESATSMGLQARKVLVEIPSFSADTVMLNVGGEISGSLTQALDYLNTSTMLRSALGDLFAEARGSGNASAALRLGVPLGNPSLFTMAIDANVDRATLRLFNRLPEATELTGSLRITEKSIETTEPLRGLAGGAPLSVSASTTNGVAAFDVALSASPADFERLIRLPEATALLKKTSGAVPVRAAVEVGLTDGARAALGSSLRVTGTSTLEGLSSTLPIPFAKAPVEKWTTDFRFDLSEAESRLIVRSGERAAFDLNIPANGPATGVVALGRGLPGHIPVDDLHVLVDEPYLSFDDWHPVVGDLLRDSARGNTPAASGAADNPENPSYGAADALSLVRVQIGDLVADDKHLTDIDATLRRYDGGWHLRLGSKEASGQVELQNATHNAPAALSVKLNRLYVPEKINQQFESMLSEKKRPSVTALPDVTLVVDDLQVGERRVGKVELRATNVRPGNTWRIDTLAVRNAGGTISGHGFWRPDPSGETSGRTSIDLTADVKSIGTVLQSLNIKDAIRRAPAKGKLKFAWSGAPYAPELETLSGSIDLLAGAGQILQIEPGAGRLLSLMSMQHLLNRLRLDFRDVISKGFSFDTMLLQAKLQNGVMHADKAAVNGSSATVLMAGDADFVRNRLDLKAVVLPSLNAEGASLALAFANPAVGLGTFLAQLVLKDHISELLKSEYIVTGSMDNPSVTKLEHVELDPFAAPKTENNNTTP